MDFTEFIRESIDEFISWIAKPLMKDIIEHLDSIDGKLKQISRSLSN